MTTTQRKSISNHIRQLSDLRTLTTNLTNLLDVEDAERHVCRLDEKLKLLEEGYGNISIYLDQFYILLKSCPEKDLQSESEPEFDCLVSDSKLVNFYKNSDQWKDLNRRIKLLIANVSKQKNAINKVGITHTQDAKEYGKLILPLSQNHVDVKNECKDNLIKIEKDINDILADFSIICKIDICTDFKHPILKSMKELSNYVKRIIDNVEKIENRYVGPVVANLDVVKGTFLEQTRGLLQHILLLIQAMYKRHLPQENGENAEVLEAIDEIIKSGNKEESKYVIEDKHLKYHLEEKLSLDTKCLDLDELIDMLQEMLHKYLENLFEATEPSIKTMTMRIIPILEQALLFAQYFITQKVAVHRVSCKMLSVLLKIFTDVASKG